MPFLKAFPDNKVGNRPYKVLFGQEYWMCSVVDFTGTFNGLMTAPDGKVIQLNGKKFKVEFCTVAHWKNGEIIEERLCYDNISLNAADRPDVRLHRGASGRTGGAECMCF